MMKKISQQRSKVLFISGDRHLFETYEHKKVPEWSYQSYEITSSGMHAKQYPGRWDETPNNRQVKGIDFKTSFCFLLQPLTSGSNQKVELSVYSSASSPLYQNTLMIK